jgi:hypothetical protein
MVETEVASTSKYDGGGDGRRGGHYRWLCSAVTGDRKEELRLDRQKKMSLYKE